MTTAPDAFGALAPGWVDRAVIGATSAMPNNWLGLRLAILLRRIVTMRLERPAGALDVARWGVRMRLHPRDNGCEKNLLFTPQMYEPVELRAIVSEIAQVKAAQRPFTFVDIGANVGLFSLFVAAHAGHDARIIAVEPEPGNLARFQFNLAANPGLPIRPIPIALWHESGTLAVALNRSDRGGTRTDPVGTGAETTRVRSRTLVELLADEDIAEVDALKIDVEGNEDAILVPFFRDGPRSLRPRMIVIEDSQGSWKHDLFALFAAEGYTVVARSKQNVVLRRPAS